MPEVIDEGRALKALQEEKQICGVDPLELIRRGYLYIKTKIGNLEQFKLNPPQQQVFDRIVQLRREKKPIRVWILKSRQLGCSTLTEALIYSLTSQQENRNSLIMADEVDKSNYLFEMTKLYHEKLADKKQLLAPELKKSNQKKLEFEGRHSQVIIETGQNPAAARAFTYQYVHLSEVAYFPKLREVMDGLMQAVPDHWDTLVVGETTANGVDNEFYTEWGKAKRGESDWIPLFLGWYMMPEYSRTLENGEFYTLEGLEYDTDGGLKDFIKEEELLQRTHNLTNEQLNWRRYTIKNKCGGKVSTFRQEHPADDEEAFLASGYCVFDKLKLKMQKECAEIKDMGTLYREEFTNKVKFRKEIHGKFRTFRDINPRIKAVIGGDVAEGVGQNECAAVALDMRTNNTIMGYKGQTDPDLFAEDLALMGEYCNFALIAPENNNHGYATCSRLKDIYKKVYKVKIGQGEEVRYKYGWTTDKRSRPEMISHLQTEIREDSTELRDPDLVDQCLSFVRKPNGKIEAQEGKNDDYVMARMIAGELRILYPFHERSMEGKIDVFRNRSKHKKRPSRYSGKSPGY